MKTLIELGQLAKKASYKLANTTTVEKNTALQLISEALKENSKMIVEENKKDIDKAVEKGTPEALLDRLRLTEERIADIADAVLDIIALEDPVGEVMGMWKRPNNMTIGKKRVPLGVIGIIYESRPNVTVDAAALCLKTGNAVLLRGGVKRFILT